MNWPFNEDDYCFCLGVTINFGISKIFEINIIFQREQNIKNFKAFFLSLWASQTLCNLDGVLRMVSYEETRAQAVQTTCLWAQRGLQI